MFLKNIHVVLFIGLLQVFSVPAQNIKTIDINTSKGHSIKRGASGFNVRIADKVWSYTHPEFVEIVKELKPGWLRFFSGTMGDAFSSATGQYDLDYIAMFDHQKEFLKGHHFVETKGPHRLTDLYRLLREINGKLIITVNAFTESPEMILELARFCKNNNIKVETWQFCNEPYFYIPNRNRYWWNDGYDYAAKMQPYAEVIKQIFPDANLALNYTWDGVWTFMKEINEYQKEHGAYWNVFSKHSYAPHTGKKETLEQAYKRANTKLIEATSPAAMDEIEAYTWKDVPMVITEFGVWNSPLNGIYSSIYNIEYVMRQLQHTNTQYVGAHEVSNKYVPLNGKNKLIEDAFENRLKIETDTILTGIRRDLEGKAYKIFHEATNNSDFLFETNILNAPQVPGLSNKTELGMYAQSYRGCNGYNYLVITNRSGESNNFQVKTNGKLLQEKIETSYISADSLTTFNTNIQETYYKDGLITIKPYSITVCKWKSETNTLAQPTIYEANIEKDGVLLHWGMVSNASNYKIYYGTDISNLDKTLSVVNQNSVLVKGLELNKAYYFKVGALNNKFGSTLSESVSVVYQLPRQPKIFKVSRRDDAVTLFWQSVPNATGYLINYTDEHGKAIEINTDNVFGYRMEGFNDHTTYQFTVTAYNGLGKGLSSEAETVLVSSRVPLSPRNVSATKNTSNSIEVKWHAQDEVLPNTCYNVYRGEKLHEFIKIATCIQDTIYTDNDVDASKQYYYTVKAQTEVGESNFHPNIATTLSVKNADKITIQFIETQESGYLVKVKLNKMSLNPKDDYGVIINNVSYLNVEDLKISGAPEKEGSTTFNVFIPLSKVKENSNYAIKAFVTKQGKTTESAIVNQKITK
ncbi:fibronectin type III domain-containing protein [Mariniflexile sp.]|uniref:fibronectin type III domain-containing protein n=1 Tax=Mariniflexile sp. TaxID=1979402 RepID=UPI0035647302